MSLEEPQDQSEETHITEMQAGAEAFQIDRVECHHGELSLPPSHSPYSFHTLPKEKHH